MTQYSIDKDRSRSPAEFSGGQVGAKRCTSTADLWINKSCSVNAVSKLVADFSNKINNGARSVFMVVAGPAEISARTYYPLNGNGADFHAANKAAVLSITRDTAG